MPAAIRQIPIEATAWVVGILIVACAAAAEVNRVASGRLFLLATSYEAQPSMLEQNDAISSASRWRYPAIGAVFCVGCLGYSLTRKPYVRPTFVMVIVFLCATAMDLFTTLQFFHSDGIDTEAHPGVRLLGYAYGRTAGPVIAKAVQAVGVLFVASRLPAIAKPLLAVTSLLYTLAAMHNAGLL